MFASREKARGRPVSPRPSRRVPFSLLILFATLGWAAGCNQTPAPPRLPEVPGGPSPEGASTMAFAPDGKAVASWDWDDTLSLRDVGTKRPLHSVPKANRANALTMAFTADGKTLATGHWDGTVKLWDVAGLKEKGVLTGHGTGVTSLAFAADGKTLAAGTGMITGVGSQVKVWDADARKVRKTFIDKEQIYSLALTADGKSLATGTAGSAKIWDWQAGKVRLSLEGKTDQGVAAIAFSPDGKTLAGAISPGTVKLWDVATGQVKATLQGGTAEVQRLAFAPDGKALAGACADKSARVWDVATGKERCVLTAQAQPVLAVAFTPDGATVLTGARDKTIKAWDAATGKEVVIHQ